MSLRAEYIKKSMGDYDVAKLDRLHLEKKKEEDRKMSI